MRENPHLCIINPSFSTKIQDKLYYFLQIFKDFQINNEIFSPKIVDKQS